MAKTDSESKIFTKLDELFEIGSDSENNESIVDSDKVICIEDTPMRKNKVTRLNSQNVSRICDSQSIPMLGDINNLFTNNEQPSQSGTVDVNNNNLSDIPNTLQMIKIKEQPILLDRLLNEVNSDLNYLKKEQCLYDEQLFNSMKERDQVVDDLKTVYIFSFSCIECKYIL